MSIGLMEWIIIFAIVLLLFGGKQIPKLVKTLKEAKEEFKKPIDGILTEETAVENEEK